MTPVQIETAKALARCSFLPGSPEKRFARDMAQLAVNSPDRDLSERQAWNLLRLAHRYRRQMPASLVPAEVPAPPASTKSTEAAPPRPRPVSPCLFDEAWTPTD